LDYLVQDESRSLDIGVGLHDCVLVDFCTVVLSIISVTYTVTNTHIKCKSALRNKERIYHMTDLVSKSKANLSTVMSPPSKFGP